MQGFPAMGFYPSSFPCRRQFNQISRGTLSWQICFTDVKWKSKLCEKSNTNKWFPNCAGLERKYKLTSGHSTQSCSFSVFCLSHHMDCTDCTIVLLHAFPSPGSRFWQRAVWMCPCHEPPSFQIGEQEMMFVHRLCPPPSDYWGLQVDS